MQDNIFIGILGKRNQGKSTLMNAITNQNTSIVSATPGTTTDPVKKSIEISGLGKCILVDTAGWDDIGNLGSIRAGKTLDLLPSLHVAIVLFSENTFTEKDKLLCSELNKLHIPFILLHNKKDLVPLSNILQNSLAQEYPQAPMLDISTVNWGTKPHIEEHNPISLIAEAIKKILAPNTYKSKRALEGLLLPGDHVVMVTPIDSQAPKGRLILPQVQMARQCLDFNAYCSLTQVSELKNCLNALKKPPRIVITDSQVFKEVSEIIPEQQALTSFSICLAREKGLFGNYLEGTPHINQLQNGDRLLILESCTHQVNCEDIGRVKLPNLLRQKTGKQLEFDFVSGLNPLPKDLKKYAMAIQCGGCMITGKQLSSRLQVFVDANIPISNYGISLAFLQGIFKRAIAPFELHQVE